MKKTTDLRSVIRNVRKAGVPLVVVRTPDNEACTELIASAVTEFETSRGVEEDKISGLIFYWRPGTGLWPVKPWPEGCKQLAAIVQGAMGQNMPALQNASNKTEFEKNLRQASAKVSGQLWDMNQVIERYLPEDGVVIAHNFHILLDQPQTRLASIQTIANLRTPFSSTARTWIGLCPGTTLPPELVNDIIVADDPMPDREELAAIVAQTYADSELPAPTEATVERCVDSIAGLASFPAKQVCAMSLTRKGMDLDLLSERHRKQIEQTPGLSVELPKTDFGSLGGLLNVKSFFRDMMTGPKPPRLFVLLDEMEKSLNPASMAGDNTGISQDQVKKILEEIEEETIGMTLLGIPGTGKSAIVKALAREFGVMVLRFDMGGMKSSLAGSSEARMRQAMATIRAISEGRACYIGTVNGWKALTTELQRRFGYARFFFDLPDKDELPLTWESCLRKYDLTGQQPLIEESSGWTGAEVDGVCKRSAFMGMSLKRSAEFLVPSLISQADRIRELREEATGMFISATYPGPYRVPIEGEEVVVPMASTLGSTDERPRAARRTKI